MENRFWKSKHCKVAGNFFPLQLDIFFSLSKNTLKVWGFPGGAVVENLPANAGDTGSSPGLGRSHMPRSD